MFFTPGLYGVGKAAIHPPALAILSHTPPGADANENIAWVGKGIVYDTGGLSIKGKVRQIYRPQPWGLDPQQAIIVVMKISLRLTENVYAVI